MVEGFRCPRCGHPKGGQSELVERGLRVDLGLLVVTDGAKGLHASELGVSLKTTNILESIHARVEDRTARVDHWRNSEQKQRWLATAPLDLEPRLDRIKNYRLPNFN